MSIWLELLTEAGCELSPEEMAEFTMPDEPVDLRIHKTEDEVDYENWTLEHEHGQRDEGTGFGLDFEDELRMLKHKVHRYSRVDRFKSIMLQLLGVNGALPNHVVDLVKADIGKYVNSKHKIWNTIRKILKTHELRKYYNRIPKIINELTSMTPSGTKEVDFHKLLREFSHMSNLFNNKYRQKWGVSYFPNLRYVALRMIQHVGIVYPYHVPLLRTKRKGKYLGKFYDALLSDNSNTVKGQDTIFKFEA